METVVWILSAGVALDIAAACWLYWLAGHAPMDTEVWVGGEPR